MNKAPQISVIMPVYNGEKYLKEAIESILDQTFRDFEFIIINDGSTDKTAEIIKSFNDARIQLINQKNAGIILSLNRGISESRGKYIARMDADDISLPERLEKEYRFLEQNPKYGIVGTTFLIINKNNQVIGVNAVLLENEDLKKEIIIETTFGHGTVMMRKSVLDTVGYYNPKALHAEDFDLWTRFAEKSKMANLSEVLYLWRDNPQGISRTKNLTQSKNAQKIQEIQIYKFANLNRQKIINFKKNKTYHDEKIEYNGQKVVIQRKKRLSFIYFIISYHALQQKYFLLALKMLFMGLIIHPATIWNILSKKTI